MMNPLAKKTCSSCMTASKPLERSEFEPLRAQLPSWEVIDEHHLRKSFKVKNFMKALELANKVAEIAEEENHHPDLLVRWGELGIDIWTHKVNGLTEADFVLAAKIDNVLETK
jgi:4a-hydroxytetrahydrobiopterin dehydratase